MDKTAEVPTIMGWGAVYDRRLAGVCVMLGGLFIVENGDIQSAWKLELCDYVIPKN